MTAGASPETLPAGESPQAANLRLLHRYHETEDPGEKQKVLEALTENNAGLVRSVAYRYRDRVRSSCADTEDLVQIGTIGMLKAIRSFDFSYETTFATYAVPLIIGEIRRFLRDDGTVKVSREVRRRGSHVLSVREAWTKEHGREPTVSELAEASGEETGELSFLLDAASPVHSLSDPLGTEEGGEAFSLEQVLSEEESAIDRLTDRLSLRQAVSGLPEIERKMLYLRYAKQLSQQQTAVILGITQVKVSRTEKKIFGILRKELESR